MADKYALLQKILKALGLSEERIEQILAWIEEWQTEDAKSGADKDGRPQRDPYPYHLRDHFLTPAEHAFYQTLTAAIDGWAVICPKVRLGDIFYAQTPNRRHWWTATNKVNQKHVDFLLCDPETMRPLLGVELNDRSHSRPDRKERDRFVVGAFEASGLPLAGVRVRAGYPVDDLARFLRQKAGVENGAQPPAASPTGSPAPTCPECGSEMVLRTARRGPQAGQSFWGCSAYPDCRAIIPTT